MLAFKKWRKIQKGLLLLKAQELEDNRRIILNEKLGYQNVNIYDRTKENVKVYSFTPN